MQVGPSMISLVLEVWKSKLFLWLVCVVFLGWVREVAPCTSSTRSIPLPPTNPTTTTPSSPTVHHPLRPNISIQTYSCPPEYDLHYCLNGAHCFTVQIGGSLLYNCECSEGYMGQRCEFKDLEGSYLPSKHRTLLEAAGLTSSVLVIILIVVGLCFYLWVRREDNNNTKNKKVLGKNSPLPSPLHPSLGTRGGGYGSGPSTSGHGHGQGQLSSTDAVDSKYSIHSGPTISGPRGPSSSSSSSSVSTANLLRPFTGSYYKLLPSNNNHSN